MTCLRRRKRWTVVVILATIVMFFFNLVFLVDLTVNHHAHSHLIDVLPDIGGRGKIGGVVSGEQQFYTVQVTSSKERVEILVREKKVYGSGTGSKSRGIHVVVLHQSSGEVMASRVFDTYMPGGEEDLVGFLNGISDGRILCLAIEDEGTFSLKESGRSALAALGSRLSSSVSWRDMWVLVTIKGGMVLGEDIGKSVNPQEWGPPVKLKLTVPVEKHTSVECDWPRTSGNMRRSKFCARYEGYGALCHCARPLPLYTVLPPLVPNNIEGVPVTIIASNRPHYLFRMLQKLLSVPGASPLLITVFIDGFFQEPLDVAELFNVRAIQHEPKSQKNGRISQHYKASLSETFDLYSSAAYTIVIEEDLNVAPDFFSYFSQTVGLMEEDESIYCISAWNDQGYAHSSQDPALLYRVETMPGLGWLLKRKLFKEELEPNWPGPDKLWDWDMWMRLDAVRKGRECIIPDISRTFHFGASGLNMNPYFHDHYFKNHIINTIPNITLRDTQSLTAENYEAVIHGLFREASVLDHNKDPCSDKFVPNTKGKVYVIYITMDKARHFDHWMKLASCFKLWDLDARGFHKGLWRFWLKGNHILVVGHPYSPYSAKYKPLGITPLVLATSDDTTN